MNEVVRSKHATEVALPESLVEVNLAEATRASADATRLSAEAFASVVEALDDYENGIVDLDTCVVIKVTVAGRSAIALHRLDAQQRRAVDRLPELKQDPQHFLSRLAMAIEVGAVAELDGGS